MATLIPSLSSVARKMTGGERRFAQQLESHLEDDYLCWYDVPVGPSHAHPDFMVLHPRRGLLVLEVKDWKLDTISAMDRVSATLKTYKGLKAVINPLEQARQYAHHVSDLLEADPALVWPEAAPMQGRLVFPWGYGVVLTNITRKALENPTHAADLRNVLLPERLICQDEMLEAVDREGFQKRLWGMFSVAFRCALSMPQIDRIRWHLFPEIRVGSVQGAPDVAPAE